MTKDELNYLEEEQRRKIEKTEESIIIARSKTVEEHFDNVHTRQERNIAIGEAHRDGHTQSRIADHLGVSTSLVSKVVRSKGAL